MVLFAIVATLRIALNQPDQTATTKTRSRRDPGAGMSPDVAAGGSIRTAPAPPPAGRASSSPAIGSTPMPAGFQWMDAAPAPKVRSGFALVVILAFLGAMLAMAVAGMVAALSVAIQGI